MSLMRQLWLAVVVSTLVAFVGSLSISVWSARSYLIEQLERKNSDNASSLALAMTQQEKDPVNIELQVAALFDTGYYQLISVVDPLGKVIVERVHDVDIQLFGLPACQQIVKTVLLFRHQNHHALTLGRV